MNVNKDQKQKRGLTEINLTSLIDVSLTLVIIFMVSYPLVMQSGINVATPSMQKTKTVLEETELKARISLKENDDINWTMTKSPCKSKSLRVMPKSPPWKL